MGMIDRENVIAALHCIAYDDDFPCWKCAYYKQDEKPVARCDYRGLMDDAISLLEEQEAVARKTGHWIYLQDCANEGVYCSECHTKMFDRYPMKKKLSQFCAHCGAKMDEDVEGR